MLFSAVYHLFHCCSADLYVGLAKLDYGGISFMIVGSYYPPLFYGFACHPTERAVYITLISLLGVVAITISWLPVFASANFRVFRAAFFVVFGSFAVFPLPHLWYVNEPDFVWPLIWGEAMMGSCYILGVVVYASRFPESYYPGKFDVSFLSSHVIWHYFTIVAALFQWAICVYVAQLRKSFPCAQ